MESDDPVRIGDFTRPVVEGPKSPAKDALVKAESKLEQDAQKDEASLKPMQSYEEQLRELGITRAKASEIVDAVLLKGYYAEEIPITKSIKARLRTRNARDTKRAQDMLESQRLTYEHHYNELLSRYLLAASLERFGNDRLEFPEKGASIEQIEEMYRRRLTYVEEMSDPALRIMFVKLGKFDQMVAAVLREGSVENF